MRFACQSCGKAYNLPEEKVADKSNVKLKCRVCGAIVEVKRQGEVVAQLLGEGDAKRIRVSEAPAPLTALGADDDADDATQAIAVNESSGEAASDEERAAALLGHVKSALAQGGIPPLPPPPATGFAPTPVPPPLAQIEPAPPSPLPPVPRSEPLPPLARPDPPMAPPLPNLAAPVASPPPPLPPLGFAEPPALNGAGAPAPRFADVMPLADEPGAFGAPAPFAMAAPLADAGGVGAMTAAPVPQAGSFIDDTTRKMLASFVTGVLIGFIIARLFF